MNSKDKYLYKKGYLSALGDLSLNLIPKLSEVLSNEKDVENVIKLLHDESEELKTIVIKLCCEE